MRRNLLLIAAVICVGLPTKFVVAGDYAKKKCPLGECKYSQPLTAEQKNEFTQMVVGNIGRVMVLGATLNVTKDQKAKMKEAFKAHEDEFKARAKKICDAGKAIDAAVSNDESATVVQSRIDDMENALSATILEFLSAIQDARKVLTSGQKKQINFVVQKTIKSNEEFSEKTGLCPFVTAIKMKHSKGSDYKKYFQHYKKKHDSKKSHDSKHSEHRRQMHEEFKKMIIGNIGRLMVLYSDMDISVEQKNDIKKVAVKRLKTIKEPLMGLHGRIKPMLISITSDQNEKQNIQAADKMASSIIDMVKVIVHLRRDIRSQLTLDQKNSVRKTRKEIEKSVQNFKAKAKKMKAEMKSQTI